MKKFRFRQTLRLANIALMTAIFVNATIACAQTPQPSDTQSAFITDREIVLALSLELSSEPGNEAALVGRLIHSHWFVSGDQLDLTQRFSNLRKEFVGKYARPTNLLDFSIVSHELRLADLQQFITAEKTLRSSQASYRNLFGRQTGLGLIGVGWAGEALRLDSETGVAPYIADYIKREGRTSNIVPLLAYWSYDRREGDAALPSGHYDFAAIEWGGLLGKTRYSKFDFSHESFWAVAPRISAGFRFTIGYLKGLDGHLSPINKRYFGGGVGSVRGYESGALGPSDSSGAIMGADRKATLTGEVLWHAFDIGPTPIIISAFVDRGRFYVAENSAISGASAGALGLGVSVPVPIGLMRLSFARPSDETQRTQRFQFDAKANWK